jgi:hypothetical protein
MATAEFDFKNVVVTCGSFEMTGFMDGSVITVRRNGDSVSHHTGADGEVTISVSHDLTGSLELNLKQSSSANTVLSTFLVTQENGGGIGTFPIFIKDLNSDKTIMESTVCWCSKWPDVTYAAAGDQGRLWKIGCANLRLFVGGYGA